MARGRPTGDSWLVVLLRLGVVAVASVAALWEAATISGLFGGALGAVLGCLAGELLSRTRARLPLGLVIGGALGALGALGWGWPTGSSWLVALLGARRVVDGADALMMSSWAAALTLILRLLAARYRIMAFAELALLAAALSAPLAPHRGGAINRPLMIGDYAWARGEDPLVYLQLVGGVAAVVLALFLIAERRWTRAFVAMGVVLLLSTALGLLASMVQPPPTNAQQGLGLTGEGEEDGRPTKGSRSLDQLDFRDNYESQRQNAPIAVVLLHDDFMPPAQAYYFRQNAFSKFNGRRLVPALDVGVDQDIFEVFPSAKKTARWIPPETYRMPVKTTVALLQDHVNPVVLEAAETVAPARNPSPRRFRRVYNANSLALDVELGLLVGTQAGDPSWSDAVRRLYAELPDDPRYGELARNIVKQLPAELNGDAVAQAAAVAFYLGQKGTYSLRSRHASAEDPTASFLFGDLTGYCVHFAHAAVYLMRSLGIPSRLATGYQYPAIERGRGSSLLIRAGDAHAWAEIFLAQVGWVVVDVAPARNLEAGGMPVDPELQRMLGEMLRGQLAEQSRAVLEISRPRWAFSQLVALLRTVAQGVIMAIVALLAVLYLGKAYRRLAPVVGPPSERTRLSYRQALDRLSEVGQRRRYGEPPELFARRLGNLVPSFAPLVEAACARRLGSRRREAPPTALVLGRQVKRELRRSLPWWRRVWGLLDPFSWLRVR